MFNLLAVLAVLGLSAWGASATWRRIPAQARDDLDRLARDLRVRTGSYSLKLVMQRMVDEMRASVMPGLRKAYVPNRMRFGLHPDDARRWGNFFDQLTDELRDMLLAEIARRPELHLSGTLEVSLSEDTSALPGRPTFAAAMCPRVNAGFPGRASRSTVREHDGQTRLDPRAFETVIASGWRLSLEDGRSLTLADRMVLGRGDDATLRVEDEGVSREHARLCLLEDRVSVVDLGSTNGTWVNGEQVEMALLRDGDRVRFGTDLNAVVERFGA